MVDRYAPKRARVARMLKRWNTGSVTLTRAALGTIDETKPWIVPAADAVDVYALAARVDGVGAEDINGTTILATDLVVIASPKATHTLTDGEPADGAIVDIEPKMTDTLQIDGATKTIKHIDPTPAAGSAAVFRIFVAS